MPYPKGRSGGTVQLLASLALFSIVALSLADTTGRLRLELKYPVPGRYVVFDLGTNFIPVGINDSNVMVGSYLGQPAVLDLSATNVPSALNTTNAAYTNLLSDYRVVGIDNAGHILGNIYHIDSTLWASLPSQKVGCYWDASNAAPILLGQGVQGQDTYLSGGPLYQTTVAAVSGPGYIVGNCGQPNCALEFNTNWMSDTTNMAHVLALDTLGQAYGGTPVSGDGGTGWAVASAGSDKWAGGYFYSDGTNTYYAPVINGTRYLGYLGTNDYNCFFYGINQSSVVAGIQGTNAVFAKLGSGTSLNITNLGPGVASYLNNLTTTNIVGTTTNISDTPQIVGYSGTNGPMLWDRTEYNGLISTNTTYGGYVGKRITSMLHPTAGTRVEMYSIAGINNYGLIIGTAYFTPVTQEGVITGPSVIHGVVLLPCQLSLLNGDTNTADRDGMYFDGTRPTMLSALTATTSAAFTSNNIYYQQGLDVLGPLLPLGSGRNEHPGQDYCDSLAVVAKVSSPTSNVTLAWDRVYQTGEVTISFTATNTWYVTSVNRHTGITQEDTGDSAFYTSVPSTNYNVVAFGDNPGMYLPKFNSGTPHINDFAYHKFDFTYFLTNSIGSVSAVAQLHVGQIMVVKRIATTGVNANDWTNVVNIVSTTNIPNCTHFTTNEIQNIVGTNYPISFSTNVPVSP